MANNQFQTSQEFNALGSAIQAKRKSDTLALAEEQQRRPLMAAECATGFAAKEVRMVDTPSLREAICDVWRMRQWGEIKKGNKMEYKAKRNQATSNPRSIEVKDDKKFIDKKRCWEIRKKESSVGMGLFHR